MNANQKRRRAANIAAARRWQRPDEEEEGSERAMRADNWVLTDELFASDRPEPIEVKAFRVLQEEDWIHFLMDVEDNGALRFFNPDLGRFSPADNWRQLREMEGVPLLPEAPPVTATPEEVLEEIKTLRTWELMLVDLGEALEDARDMTRSYKFRLGSAGDRYCVEGFLRVRIYGATLRFACEQEELTAGLNRIRLHLPTCPNTGNKREIRLS